MEKISLTREMIKNDYRKHFPKANIIKLVIATLVAGIILAFLIYSNYMSPSFSSLVMIIFTSLVPTLSFLILCDSIMTIRRVNNDEFYITTDKLVERQQKKTGFGNAVLISQSKPYAFIFKSYGKYIVMDGKHYTSSESLEMNEIDMYNSAYLGDEFYLVIGEKRRILLAYNKRFFELEE